jgi:hypothetical protein
MFLRTQTTGGRTYLLLVESERVDGKIKQRALHRLGRLDQTQASGQLDALISALGRFSTKLAVLGAYDRGESVTTRTRSIGPALIFERLWLETGIRAVLEDALRERRFEFSVERAVFLKVLHRLFVSGSDRAAERWRHAQAVRGSEELSLHHLYRAMGFLGEPLAAPEGDSPFDLRTRKDEIEEALFARRRDLSSALEIEQRGVPRLRRGAAADTVTAQPLTLTALSPDRRRDTTPAQALQPPDESEVCPTWCRRWVEGSTRTDAARRSR